MGLILYCKRILGIHSRPKVLWLLDLLGLFIQGTLVPLVQTFLLAKILNLVLPDYSGVISIHPLLAFCLSFVAVDYLYYWNHRLLHSNGLWALHKVHHSIEAMDILATSRNSLWTVFFIVYMWIQALFVYLLKDPTWFIVGLTVGFTLDVWRHSGWQWKQDYLIVRLLRVILIDPQDHEWHHSNDRYHVNYGANLNIWDRLHGTFFRNPQRPTSVGVPLNGTFITKFFNPWRLK